MDAMDADKNGIIDFVEFACAMHTLIQLHREVKDPADYAVLNVDDNEVPVFLAWQQRLRKSIWATFDNPTYSATAACIAILIITAILVSSLSFALETLPSVHRSNGTVFFAIDAVCSIIFTIEYGLRLASCPSPPGYGHFFIAPLNVVDLLSFLPFYIELMIDSSDSDGAATVLRALRLLRVFRLVKLSRYIDLMGLLLLTMSKSGAALSTMFFVTIIAVVLLSSLLFTAERERPDVTRTTLEDLEADGFELDDLRVARTPFESIPIALWWCVTTMTTTGYGDMVPVTLWGRILASITAVCGVFILAVPISVIQANFKTVVTRADRVKKLRADHERNLLVVHPDDDSVHSDFKVPPGAAATVASVIEEDPIADNVHRKRRLREAHAGRTAATTADHKVSSDGSRVPSGERAAAYRVNDTRELMGPPKHFIPKADDADSFGGDGTNGNNDRKRSPARTLRSMRSESPIGGDAHDANVATADALGANGLRSAGWDASNRDRTRISRPGGGRGHARASVSTMASSRAESVVTVGTDNLDMLQIGVGDTVVSSRQSGSSNASSTQQQGRHSSSNGDAKVDGGGDEKGGGGGGGGNASMRIDTAATTTVPPVPMLSPRRATGAGSESIGATAREAAATGILTSRTSYSDFNGSVLGSLPGAIEPASVINSVTFDRGNVYAPSSARQPHTWSLPYLRSIMEAVRSNRRNLIMTLKQAELKNREEALYEAAELCRDVDFRRAYSVMRRASVVPLQPMEMEMSTIQPIQERDTDELVDAGEIVEAKAPEE